MSGITIVTCLYDIRKKEGSTAVGNKNLDDYLRLGERMLTGAQLPMVVFTDDARIADHVRRVRQRQPQPTEVVWLPFEETLFYADLSVLQRRMGGFTIANWNRDKDTPLYVILNNNKFDFMRRAVAANYFQTGFFMWVDMGVQHCADATDEEWAGVASTWPSILAQYPDRIHQLRVHTVLRPDGVSWKDYFRYIYHHVAGGVFGGRADVVLRYADLFCAQWRRMLDEEGWWQLDEAVMTVVAEENPQMFRFFHGDYDGIIANFATPRKSFFLVRQTMQRHIDANRPDLVRGAVATWDRGSGIYLEVIRLLR